jgi:ribosomal protein L11 methyltransferase
MTTSTIEVEIPAEPRLREHLMAILGQTGFEGFWEDGEILRCYISENRWSPSMFEEVQSTVSLIARSSSSAIPRIRVTSIPSRNWNEEWEKTISPIQVTDRIVITPTWHQASAQPGQIVLTIDPKMSFGTGYHETTRLVLRLMERHLRQGAPLLDIGTGTGILAIAGVKLGAGPATAVDVDEWSYDNAIENAVLNGVGDRVRVLLGELAAVPEGAFGTILANIQLNVIEPILGEIRRRLAPGGAAILSGLLVLDEEEISGSLAREGLRVRERITENEWLAVACDHRID